LNFVLSEFIFLITKGLRQNLSLTRTSNYQGFRGLKWKITEVFFSFKSLEIRLIWCIKYLNLSMSLPWREKLCSWLVLRRRYSTQPTSPLSPILLLPYPNGFAGPDFSFSVRGREKNLKASDSNWDIASIGIPWFMTLKNPKSSQDFTMRLFASGFDRSTRGIDEENVVGCMLFLT